MLKYAADDKSQVIYELVGELQCRDRKDSGDGNGGTVCVLAVPFDLIRGVNSALGIPGISLPDPSRSINGMVGGPSQGSGSLDVYSEICVIPSDEMEVVDMDIRERGKEFRYGLGPVVEITNNRSVDVEKKWAIKITSPELQAVRRSYGLPSLPVIGGVSGFTCVVAQKTRGVAQGGPDTGSSTVGS